MNKLELVDFINKELNYPKKEIREIIDLFLDTIIDELKNDKKVVLSNFGTFESNMVKEHFRFHPQTGEKIMIKFPKRIKFKPSESFKIKVNE